MTELRVDLTAPTPVYEQIRAQVAGLVAVGALAAGERLPASRDLARDLGVAVGTVQRAYRELEAAGVVTSRRRTGTVVAPRDVVPGAPAAAGGAA
ncbi:GntR family transcriptional regulator, partial [Actinotalea ferrariae]|uniref:GntR family transcriptional regulator n=1 Tax=Actinotalea ferrariae TaxID=1386098 RepID=UPI001C8BA18D